jgi:hypothetical protein
LLCVLSGILVGPAQLAQHFIHLLTATFRNTLELSQ